MNDSINFNFPALLPVIKNKCAEIGFDMPADMQAGSLLKTLVASKPASNILELGTGIGASLCWMVEGMDAESRLISIDNDAQLIEIAREIFGEDSRIEISCIDGDEWIASYSGASFDLIFADAWPGKYSQIDAVLNMLKIGGMYVIDDMTAQPNWPDGHQDNVDRLIQFLDQRNDLAITKLSWSTGVIIAVKTN